MFPIHSNRKVLIFEKIVILEKNECSFLNRSSNSKMTELGQITSLVKNDRILSKLPNWSNMASVGRNENFGKKWSNLAENYHNDKKLAGWSKISNLVKNYPVKMSEFGQK